MTDYIDIIYNYVFPIINIITPFILWSYQKKKEALSKRIIVIRVYQIPDFLFYNHIPATIFIHFRNRYDVR